MEASIATELAVDAVKAVVMTVAGRVFEEVKDVWGFKDHLENLKTRFEVIQAVLVDLGNGNQAAEKSQLVKTWLQRVKNAANSADNLMDDYQYEMLCRKLEFIKIPDLLDSRPSRPSFKKKCRRYMTSPSTIPIVFRIRMTLRVKKILSDLDELDNMVAKIGLNPAKIAMEAAASTSGAATTKDYRLNQIRKHAAATGSNFIGREDVQQELLQMLLHPPTSNPHDLPIIALVGIGGLGKTTLARRMLEHEKVDQQFSSKKFWTCVSEVFDIDRVLKEMHESLNSDECKFSSTEKITIEIREKLKDDKFLLVLDDVWEESELSWNSLKKVLQRFGDPSRNIVLITTRSNKVAEAAGAVRKCKLEGLSEQDGWTLLLNQTSASIEEHSHHLSMNKAEFEEVGRSIVERCKGVPLAINVMAGFLKSKKSPDEWKSILTSKLWGFHPDGEDSIFPSLLLSYEHLPSVSVKQCFAYCAIFPKDTRLEKRDLIALWAAQGFLDESKTDNIGEDCFATLLSSSFLEVEEVSRFGEVKGYTMHDLMHDLAVYVSKTDMFFLKADSKLEDASDVRHVVIDLEEGMMMPENPMTVAKQRKTIIWRNGVLRWDFIIGAQYLRVLIVDDRMTEISPSIGQLIHLRYLNLGGIISRLPEDICKLYQLQTLRIRATWRDVKGPRGLYKLKNLRHIECTEGSLLAPRGLGFLTNLQTLPPLKLCEGEERWTIGELGALDQVKGEVCIEGLEHVKNKEEAGIASLGRKDGILKLKLKWGYHELARRSDSIIDEDVLGSLEPHQNIKSLRVEGFRGKRFHGWMKTMVVKHTIALRNLIEVELIDCKECEHVPTLGQLPNLKILRLHGFRKVKCIGNEFYESSRNNINTTSVELQQGIGKDEQVVFFGALRELYIELFDELTTWTPAVTTATVFPLLEIMEVTFCPELERVPAMYFQSLKDLDLFEISGSQPVDIINYTNSLVTLRIGCCENIKSLSMNTMSSLEKLIIEGCKALVHIPTSIGKCTSLETLRMVDNPLIKGPVPDLSKLQRLGHLGLDNSGEMTRSAGRSIPHLHLLRRLDIGGFRDEEEINKFVAEMTASATPILNSTHSSNPLSLLREVSLWNCPEVKNLPQSLQLLLPPSTLQELYIWGFNELEELPEWIGNLSCLQNLMLFYCNKLKSLPSSQAMLRLVRLQSLRSSGCPLLIESCDKHDNGPESQWHKISHVPHIEFNGVTVQDLHEKDSGTLI